MMVTRVYADEHGRVAFLRGRIAPGVERSRTGHRPDTHIAADCRDAYPVPDRCSCPDHRQLAPGPRSTIRNSPERNTDRRGQQWAISQTRARFISVCGRYYGQRPQEPPRQRRGGRACVCSGSRWSDDPESDRRYNGGHGAPIAAIPRVMPARSPRAALSGTASRPECERQAAVAAPIRRPGRHVPSPRSRRPPVAGRLRLPRP